MAEIQERQAPFFLINGGLNTESSPINIPGTDAVDISNVILNNDGSAQRRKSIDIFGQADSGAYWEDITDIYDDVYGSYSAPAPSAKVFTVVNSFNEYKSYVVAHFGKSLYIYDFSSLDNLTNVDDPEQTIDLTSYLHNGNVQHYKTRFIQDRDKLFIINPDLEIGYIKLNDSNVFIFTSISFFKRDLDGNNIEVDSYVRGSSEEPTYLCIQDHTSSASNRPTSPQGDDWKDYWVRFGPYSSDANTWGSGATYITNVIEIDNKFSTACFAGGRLWCAGHPDYPGEIFFSQTIEDDLQYGRFHSKADPYNRFDSETVATDGGSLILNGVGEIYSITDYRNGVIVLAENGMWFIGGDTASAVFSAVDYSIDKIFDEGIVGPFAWCPREDEIVFLTVGGIYITQRDDILGRVKPKELHTKIKSFYRDITITNKKTCKVIYNQDEQRLFIITNFNNYDWQIEQNQSSQPCQWRDILIFNFNIKAWYTYSLADDTVGDEVMISDIFTAPIPLSSSAFNSVIDNFGDVVIDESSNDVTALPTGQGETALKNIVIFSTIYQSGASTRFAFGQLDGDNLQDFVNLSDAKNYSSSLTMAQQIFGEVTHVKQTPYLFVVFKRVESGVLDENDIDITPGKCNLSVIYNFASSTSAYKYQTARNIYRPTRWNIARYGGGSPGYDVVRIKERLRGRGNVVQLKFDSVTNYDWHIYGYQITMTASPRH